MTTTDVVIGAASGMGAAVARRLVGSGHRLIRADLDVDGVNRLAADIGAAKAMQCDITDDAALAELTETTGKLGELVVTAGLSPTMAPGRKIFDVNIVGSAKVLRAFRPLVTRGSVAVVFASMAGHFVPDHAEIDAVLDRPLADSLIDDLVGLGVAVDEPGTAYAYSKRAVMRLARQAAKDWGASGGRVLSLSPGIIDTPMGRQEAKAQPVMAQLIADSALGRMITADEVAAIAAFLVSADASALTGTDILVDGSTVASLRS